MVNPLIALAFKVFDAQAHLPIGVIKFASTAARIPLWLKPFKSPCDEAEIRAVAPLVWTGIWSELDRAARDGFSYDFRQIAYLVVFFRAPYVESPIMNGVQGRL